MRLRALFFAGVATAMLFACSDFGSNNTPAEDAGVESSTGDSADASSDDRTTDLDGGEEGSTNWIPCSQRTVDSLHFCDDFDFPSGDITQRWTANQSINGSVGQAPDAVSLPRAFNAHIDVSPTLPSRAQLVKDKPSNIDVSAKKSLVLSFWMRAKGNPFPSKTSGSSRFAHVAVLEFDNATCATSGSNRGRAVEVSFVPATVGTDPPTLRLATKGLRELCYQDGGGPQDMPTVPALIDLDYFLAAYHRVTIDMKRDVSCPSEAGGSITLRVDNNAPACIPIIAPFTKAQTLKLSLGQFIGGQSGNADTFEVWYDNVTLDID